MICAPGGRAPTSEIMTPPSGLRNHSMCERPVPMPRALERALADAADLVELRVVDLARHQHAPLDPGRVHHVERTPAGSSESECQTALPRIETVSNEYSSPVTNSSTTAGRSTDGRLIVSASRSSTIEVTRKVPLAPAPAAGLSTSGNPTSLRELDRLGFVRRPGVAGARDPGARQDRPSSAPCRGSCAPPRTPCPRCRAPRAPRRAEPGAARALPAAGSAGRSRRASIRTASTICAGVEPVGDAAMRRERAGATATGASRPGPGSRVRCVRRAATPLPRRIAASSRGRRGRRRRPRHRARVRRHRVCTSVPNSSAISSVVARSGWRRTTKPSETSVCFQLRRGEPTGSRFSQTIASPWRLRNRSSPSIRWMMPSPCARL